MDSPRSDTDAKEDVRRLTKLLEESMQEAHELRSKLQISEKCLQNYEVELEALQQDAFEKDQQHASAIRVIEEDKSNVLKDAEERILNWQLEYQAATEKLASVQKELEEKSVNTESLTKEKNETAVLCNELQEAMEALTMSTSALDQNKELVSVLQTEKRELAQRVEMLQENLEYYKENLSVLKAQLSSQTEEFKEIQEQLAVTQSELAALRATPDVKSRGNSLFAEVEDNRQQMAKDYKMMLAKFGYMKTDYSMKCYEVAKVKKENAILVDKLVSAEKEAKKYYKAFVENYEIRIKELQMTINDLKNDVKPVYLNGNESILKFAEQTVVNSRKEITSLRNEMELRSALRLSEAAELLKTRGELAQVRAELRKSVFKIAELTAALNERGSAQPATTASEPVSAEEKPTVKTEISKANTNNTLATVMRKPREVVFEEELLHDKFNSRKRDEIAFQEDSCIERKRNDIALQEESCIEEVKVSEAVDEKVAVFSEPTVKTEATDEPLQDRNNVFNEKEIQGIIKDVFVGAHEGLDMDYQALATLSLEKNCEADGELKNIESSIVVQSRIQGKDFEDEIQIDEDGFTAALMLSSSFSEYLEIEEEMKIESMLDVNFSPLPSNEKNINDDTLRPVSKRHSEGIACNLSDSDSSADPLRFDSAKCEKISPSILKVHTSCPFENTVVKGRKRVNFDRDVKENEELDVKSSGMSQETNKENSIEDTDNAKEETKPTRRRPRPKQTHPIIYMT